MFLGLINNNPALVRIKACCWTGDKPLSEPMTAWFTDSYIHHLASINQLTIKRYEHDLNTVGKFYIPFLFDFRVGLQGYPRQRHLVSTFKYIDLNDNSKYMTLTKINCNVILTKTNAVVRQILNGLSRVSDYLVKYKNTLSFSMIYFWNCDDTVSWNLSWWNTETCLPSNL